MTLAVAASSFWSVQIMLLLLLIAAKFVAAHIFAKGRLYKLNNFIAKNKYALYRACVSLI